MGGVGRKVLTAADVMSRAKSKIDNDKMDGGLNDKPAPKLFLPEVYDDFQNALLLLECLSSHVAKDRYLLIGFTTSSRSTVLGADSALVSPPDCEKRDDVERVLSINISEIESMLISRACIIFSLSQL
jgi:hypothetical protein